MAQSIDTVNRSDALEALENLRRIITAANLPEETEARLQGYRSTAVAIFLDERSIAYDFRRVSLRLTFALEDVGLI